MSYIPVFAKGFGAQSMTEEPISYGKSRVAGSTQVSYILCSKAGCMPGQPDIFTTTSQTDPGKGASLEKNQVISAYKRKACHKLHLPIGPRDEETCPFGFTFQKYAPHDDESFHLAIKTAYRQVYGNFHAMESERPRDAERRLRNGDITIRDFVRHLAKSSFYKAHYLEVVTQQRSIELNFKHLLGRPPKSQQEVLNHVEIMREEGFDRHIDALVDGAEYEEVFGSDIVPYMRGWNSPCDMPTSCFNNSAAIARSFASSDNVLHGRSTLANSRGGKSLLLESLAKGKAESIRMPEHLKVVALIK